MTEQGPADGRVDAGGTGSGGADGGGTATQERRRPPGTSAAFLPIGLVFVILGISGAVGSARIPFIVIGATFLILTVAGGGGRGSRAGDERGAAGAPTDGPAGPAA